MSDQRLTRRQFVRDSAAGAAAIAAGVSTGTVQVGNAAQADTSQVLNYVLLEFTFADPDTPELEGFIRYHHRSGVFGSFGGTWDASTSFLIGAKYHF